MTGSHPSVSTGRLALAAVAGLTLAGMVTLGACGDDDGNDASAGSEPATLEITATEAGKGAVKLDLPDTVRPGLTEITLRNEGKRPHSLQLIRVQGEHDADEVFEGMKAATMGKPFPEWFFAGGGIGEVGPGESATVQQELEAESTYWLFPDDSDELEPPVGSFEVTGEPGEATLAETGSVVTARDFSFETEGLTAGEPITFRNQGREPHHMIAFKMLDDATLGDMKAFFADPEQGPPPFDHDAGSVDTSVLEGGAEQVSAATFDPGRYALVCFISNREGGLPHVELGMIDEVEVE